MLAKTTRSLPTLKLASVRWRTVSAAVSSPALPCRRAPLHSPLRNGPTQPNPQRITQSRGHGLAPPVPVSLPPAPAACPQRPEPAKVNITSSPKRIWTLALADLAFPLDTRR